MSKRILLVDDEKNIVRVARGYLEQAGFTVSSAYDGKSALADFRHTRPDLIVLDLNLPEMDGLDVCRAMRKESNVPIIMLTARVEEADKLVGLEIGADDYVTKPFSPRELVARVRALLRRAESATAAPSEILRAGDIEMDLGKHQVSVVGRGIDLTPMEFQLLRVLMQNPGRVFSRSELLDKTQGEAFEGYERTIDAHVKNLRAKIERNPKKPRAVLTVFGVGYKFAEDL